MATLSNPILGILFGTVFTALIQSSAASVGILQTLAAAGAVEFGPSVYILFGQNIGTCITAFMASFGVSRDAKRATCVHILFNPYSRGPDRHGQDRRFPAACDRPARHA